MAYLYFIYIGERVDRRYKKTMLGITIVILLIIGILLIFNPALVWQFFEKYFIMPIIADAQAEPGVSEGEYNLFNTLAYGAFLVGALFLIYKLIKKLRFELNKEFFVALLPFIALGSILRVLEDLRFFSVPLAYLFISPIIYIFIGAIVVGIVVLCSLLSKKFTNRILFIAGVILVAVSLSGCFLIPWENPYAIVLIFILAAGATLAVFLIFRVFSVKITSLKAYLSPVSLALFGAHFLDASATFVGVDFYGYGEKHPLPGWMINIFGSAWIMYLIKFVIIFLIIYLLNIKYKTLLDPNAKWLIIMCVFILGLAPGLRDALRIGIGV